MGVNIKKQSYKYRFEPCPDYKKIVVPKGNNVERTTTVG